MRKAEKVTSTHRLISCILDVASHDDLLSNHNGLVGSAQVRINEGISGTSDSVKGDADLLEIIWTFGLMPQLFAMLNGGIIAKLPLGILANFRHRVAILLLVNLLLPTRA